jgi:hypothetical protein
MQMNAREVPRRAGNPSRHSRLATWTLIGLGLYLIGFSVWMAVSPGNWYEHVGPFGPRNDHGIRDAATFQLVFGLASFIAAKLPHWRIPVLVGLALQFGLHSINHLADINNADPRWVGVLDFATLILTTVLLISLVVSLRTTAKGRL